MSWPTWLSKTLPSWLEQTGYPYNGVGDLEDLNLTVKVTELDRWSGFVNPGWFYFNNDEDYKYINAGTQTFTTATTGTITAVTSYRPSWGPIQLKGALYGPYVQHHNIYEPGIQVTWTQIVGTQIFYFDLPSTQYLVGLRDINNTVFGAVTSLSYPLTESLYYYDITNNRVYVLSPVFSPDNRIFLDVLHNAPQLKFKEVLSVDKNLKVRLSYSRPYGMDSIIIKRATSSMTPSSGYPSVVNEFDVSALSVKEGDWVIAEYYINNSFIITNHNTLQYYSNTLGNELVTISFETSVPTTNRPISITNSIVPTNSFNINPTISDSFRSGYLFYSDTTPSWDVNSITLESDKSYFNTSQTNVKFKIVLKDINGLPIPNKSITTVNVNGATIVKQFPLTNKTDNKGELNLVLSHTSSITLTVTENSVTQTKTVDLLTLQTALSQINTSTLKCAFPLYTKVLKEESTDIYGTVFQLDGRPSSQSFYFSPKIPFSFSYLNNNQYIYASKETLLTPNQTPVNFSGYTKINTSSTNVNFLLKTSTSQSTFGVL